MTDSKVDQIKNELSNLKEKLENLNVEAKEWHFNVGYDEAGTTVEIEIKLLIPKKK